MNKSQLTPPTSYLSAAFPVGHFKENTTPTYTASFWVKDIKTGSWARKIKHYYSFDDANNFPFNAYLCQIEQYTMEPSEYICTHYTSSECFDNSTWEAKI